jgi:transposase
MKPDTRKSASEIAEYKRGYRDGLRKASTWLSDRSRAMNDPHAARVLSSAATNLGWDIKEIAGRASAEAIAREA